MSDSSALPRLVVVAAAAVGLILFVAFVVSRLLRTRNAQGVHVAGTSAGASFISEHMIAFGEEGASPVAGSVRQLFAKVVVPLVGDADPVHGTQDDRLARAEDHNAPATEC